MVNFPPSRAKCFFAAATLSLVLLPVLRGAVSASESADAVTGEVAIVKSGKIDSQTRNDASNVAVWLIPLDGHDAVRPEIPAPQLVQRNKTFEPHVLVVPVGTVVEFPNKDPFFHNIFSLFDGKRFDLGLYASGTTRSLKFDRPGVSYLFCNIHAEMSAILIAVETPYFAVTNDTGSFSIANVPDGHYDMHVWYERSAPEVLNRATREVTVSTGRRFLGRVRIVENPHFTSQHENKYGLDYVPPPEQGYSRR